MKALHTSCLGALLSAVCLVLVSACGSGSQGFGLPAAELNAIFASAESGECTIGPGEIEICAIFAPDGEGADCDSGPETCQFTRDFDLRGFEPGTQFVGAVRPQDLSLPWRTSTSSFGPADEDGRVRASVDFVTDIEPGTTGMMALLIFPPGQEPHDLSSPGLDKLILADALAPRANVMADWPLR